MTTYSSILARKIPWTEEPGGLQSRGSQRVRHDQVTDTFSWYAAFSYWLISLSNIYLSFLHIFSWLYFFFMRTVRIYSLNNFHMYHIAVITIVILLYITSLLLPLLLSRFSRVRLCATP